jgi:hypothetical protein
MEIKVDSFDFRVLKVIDVNGDYVEFDLTEELKVNEMNLLQEMLQQPSKYIYWSSLLEKLRYYQESKELELEFETARLDPIARKELTTYDGTKAKTPTKDQVEAYIKRESSYQKLRQELQHFEFIVGRVARIVKAFEQRKDMLQSYGKQVAEQKQYGLGAGTRIEDNIMPKPQFGQ